ncbi:unnamed protein product, partial [Mesorhabditis belari]|uniref:EGF-like domain-containing protein n=1 Tax=Mesorhabditis belari TaxID=2138241 RepID=A0AAF3ETC9_9BILA
MTLIQLIHLFIQMTFSTGQLLFLLFFAIQLIATKESPENSEHTSYHPRRRVVYRTTPSPFVLKCVHGEMKDSGRCACEEEYVGKHCEKKKNCATFRRYRNGTCLSCINGYAGPFCEDIMCDHGEVDPTGLKCLCEKPWVGEFCSELQTERVLSYYNNKAYMMGPLGALSIIPMGLILYFCEKMAEKRQLKRVHEQMGEDHDRRVLERLLKKEDDPGVFEQLLKKEEKDEKDEEKEDSIASNV